MNAKANNTNEVKFSIIVLPALHVATTPFWTVSELLCWCKYLAPTMPLRGFSGSLMTLEWGRMRVAFIGYRAFSCCKVSGNMGWAAIFCRIAFAVGSRYGIMLYAYPFSLDFPTPLSFLLISSSLSIFLPARYPPVLPLMHRYNMFCIAARIYICNSSHIKILLPDNRILPVYQLMNVLVRLVHTVLIIFQPYWTLRH